MGRKPKNQPSFFKILFTKNYNSQLRLPSLFVEQYKDILPENAKLRIRSGETWTVRLEQMDEDDYCFTQGWDKFTKDLGLQMFEFLVFSFNRKSSTFDVSAYGLHGCEKELLPCVGNKRSRSRLGDDEDVWSNEDTKPDVSAYGMIRCENELLTFSNQKSNSNSGDEDGSPLYFEIVFKKHQISRMPLPKKFAEASGLIDKETVELEFFPLHCYQKVKLDHRNGYRTDMATGWRKFHEANELVLGKSYSFKFNPSKNVIQVKEVKVNNETVEINSKRSKAHIADEKGSQLYFETILKQHHKSRMTLPSRFVRAARLTGKETVELEYLLTHRYQEVTLVRRIKYVTEMGAGWPKFLETNGLVFGKGYSFEFNRVKNVIQVKEVKVHNGSGLGNKRTKTLDMDDEDDSNPHFEIVLKKHQRSRVCLGKHFVETTGLNEKKEVAVEYRGGRRVYVALERRLNRPALFEMALGWGMFRKVNNLEYGKRYLFEFIPSNGVILVKQVI